jgi:hypothetical protein
MSKIIQIATSETEGEITLVVLLDDGSLWWTAIMGARGKEEWRVIIPPPDTKTKS